MTTVFSKALKLLNLWKEKEVEWLSLNELWGRKELLPTALSRKSKREFSRYLALLVEHKFLLREWDSEKGCYYFVKLDETSRRSFASLFVDFAKSRGFHEDRDVFGASIVFSQPALTDFMAQEEIDNINMYLDKANGLVTEKITRALIQKKILELPDKKKADAQAYPRNVRLYDEMRRRLALSGKVRTKKENEDATAELLAQAKLWNYDTVEEFRAKVGWRFSRVMKDIPLTFGEYEEYHRLEAKILPLKKFFERTENQAPKFLCCFWSYEMEGYFLEKHNFVLCKDNILRPTEEVIESLSEFQLLDYRKNLKKAIRSGTFHMPQWTGNEDRYQPKLRPSWDNKSARKYLRRILINIDNQLGLISERKSAENS